MTKSKTKIGKQIERKTSPSLVETIVLAKKNPKWIQVAEVLTGPRRMRKNFNVGELSKYNSGTVVVCGKVLSQGEISKKMKIAALGYSESAKEKLLNAGCEIKSIVEEINLNKEAKGVEIAK